jgi:hypothetical protein
MKLRGSRTYQRPRGCAACFLVIVLTAALFALSGAAAASAAGNAPAGAPFEGTVHVDYVEQNSASHTFRFLGPTVTQTPRIGKAVVSGSMEDCYDSYQPGDCGPAGSYTDALFVFSAPAGQLTLHGRSPLVDDGHTGVWAVESGTGRFAKASGSGTFVLTPGSSQAAISFAGTLDMAAH